MRYLYAVIAVLVIAPKLLSAQSNYKPGYIVNLKGDTVRGFIDYREWEKNPKQINFKGALNGNAQSFSPANADAFGITGLEYFKKFTVNISQDQVTMSNIKQGVDTTYVIETVFLRVLARGQKVSLFGYTDDIKTRYYTLDTAEEQPRELSYRVYYSAENSVLMQTQNRFRIQLQYLANKYNVRGPNLSKQIDDANYFEDDLKKIVYAINGSQIKQEITKSRMASRWFVGAGVANNNAKYIGIIQFSPNSSTNPEIVGGFDFFPNKNTRQLFFRVEVTATENQHAFSNTADVANSYSLSNVTQYNVALSPQLIYNIYNKENFKLFAGIGFSYNVSFYNKYYFTQTIYALPIVSNQFPDLYGKWVSFPVKAGVELNKKLEIYIGYVFPQTLTDDYNQFAGKTWTYEGGIIYFLGK